MSSPGDRGKAVRRGRDATNAHVDAATRRLLAAYQQAWATLRAELERAADDAARKAAAAGDVADPLAYRKAARLQAALSALEAAERRLALRHAAVIGPRVAPVVDIPAGVLQRIFHAEGLGAALGRPSPAALEHIVARTTQRIEALSAPLPDEARAVVHAKLLTGVATGQHPERVARAIVRNARDAFGGQLTRAMVIARTELLDASREATRLSFRASSEVVGWVWQAAVGSRTCPACLAMSGTQHGLDETLEGHPQCRCVMVPLLRGETVKDTGTLSGEQLVDQMSPEERVQSLGVTRLQLLAQGQPIRSFATKQTNPGWRASQQVTPLSALPTPKARPPRTAVAAPSPPLKTPTPRSAGTAPVSAAVDLLTRSPAVRSAVAHATDVIDQVHTDGQLEPLAFRTSPGGTLGTYSWAPGKEAILIDPNGPWSALTVAHEVGHWLDHKAMGGAGTFASGEPPSDAWRAVMGALERSQAVSGLRGLLGDPRVARISGLARHVRYLLDPREQWARAYAQWIATRSADHRLGADLTRVLDEVAAAERRAGFRVGRQWDAADFGPVATAIDELMASLGWRTPA